MERVQATSKSRPSVPVAVYGTKGCADTQKVRRYLDRLDIFYDYLNIDEELSAARQVQWWTGGSLSHPTVRIGGRILVEPGLEEVEATLAGFNII